MVWCAKFFGRFKDEHADSDVDSDGEAGASSSAGAAAKKRKQQRSDAAGAAKKKTTGSSTIALAPYMGPLRVEVTRDGNTVTQELIRIRAEKKKDFTDDMVEAISDLGKVHTIELTKCGVAIMPSKLPEMFDLRIVKICNHFLKFVEPSLGRVEYLEELHLEQGLIVSVEPRTFGPERFAHLTVLNLRFNQLVFLPQDLGFYTSKLEYLDLSHNKLVQLPEPLFLGAAKHVLQVLILDHNNLPETPEANAPPLNNLRELPDALGGLIHLRKLFASFNALEKLPTTLGGCERLQKLRLVQNQLEKLPFSILDITHNLNEVLVDRNPLKMPSLTSFKMGGLPMAWKLLAEEKENHLRRVAEEEEAARQAAAMEAGVVNLDDIDFYNVRGSTIEDEENDVGNAGAPGAGQSQAPGGAAGTGAGGAATSSAGAGGAGVPAASGGGAAGPGSEPQSVTTTYYFAGVEDRVAEIRQVQNTLLLAKKKQGLEQIQQQAKTKLEDGSQIPEDEQEHLREIVAADVSTYSEKIPVAEVDLYFYLLVYATKPLYSTCFTLFDKYDVGDKGYWTQAEWRTFVVKIPVTLPDHVEAQMWKILSGAGGGGAGGAGGTMINVVVFVAMYHLHELEEKDPQVMRITQLMDLDYYDMDVGEMERRLSAKSSGDADPTLDFNATARDRSVPVGLRHEAGEAHLRTAKLHAGDKAGAGASGDKAAPGGGSEDKAAGGSAQARKLGDIPVFLDGPAYLSKQLARDDQDSDDDLAAVELLSENLSDKSSSEDEFDALDHLAYVEEQAEAMNAGAQEAAAAEEDMLAGNNDDSNFQVGGDFDLTKMMSMAIETVLPAKYLASRKKAMLSASSPASGPAGAGAGGLFGSGGARGGGEKSGETGADSPATAAKKRKSGRKSTQSTMGGYRGRRKKKKEEESGPMDRRFRTDVLSVRKALRTVYRNLPQAHFDRAVNYILKSLRYMRSEKTEASTYWHTLDPTFNNSLGANPYCVRLLESMGFVLLMRTYWVWPYIHLNPGGAAGATAAAAAALNSANWANRALPTNCPGMHKDRLDDMILLFGHARQNMSSAKFNGFFR